MITRILYAQPSPDIFVWEFRGLDSEKNSVIDSATNGSVYFAMDTNKRYMFEGDSKTWLEVQFYN